MLYDFSELFLLKGEDYVINDKLTIHHPTLDEISQCNEEKYWGFIQSLCAVPIDYQVQLYDMGIDYTNISEMDFFALMAKNISVEQSKILFGDQVHFNKMVLVIQKDTQEPALIDYDTGLIIDKVIYTLMTEFVRKIHGLRKNEEYAKNEITRLMMIEEARRLQELQAKKYEREGFKSLLAPYVSAITNSAESSYDIFSIWKLPIYTLIDSVKRINKIRTSGYMMQGAYNGWVDGSKFSKKDLNWLGELD